jgi:hypothetical protein
MSDIIGSEGGNDQGIFSAAETEGGTALVRGTRTMDVPGRYDPEK